MQSSTNVAYKKSDQGTLNHLKGLSAEAQVVRHYERIGATVKYTRWKGQSGELDLVFEHQQTLLIVEVKSSETHAKAADLLSAAQIQRLRCTTEEFLATCANGQLTDIRMDVALVNAQGVIEILENGLMNV